MKHLTPYFSTLLLVALLAACSGDGVPGSSSPQLTQTETEKALDDLLTDVMSLAPNPQSDSSLAAFAALSVPDPAALGAEEGRLPRGVYTYNPDTGAYGFVSSSDDLVITWPYMDPDGREAAATILFDWNADGETVQASVPGTDARQEMPTGLNFQMSASSETVADVDARLTYADLPGCGVTVEPASLSVNGSGSLLTLSNVGYEVTDNGVAVGGTVALTDGSLGLAWQVSASGSVQRENCAPVDFAPQGGEASFTLSVQDERYTLSFSIEDFDAETGSAAFSDGKLIFNNQTAVTFAGTFDDSNDNGIPGDNMTVTFKGEQTATLEQLLSGSRMLNLAKHTFSLLSQ